MTASASANIASWPRNRIRIPLLSALPLLIMAVLWEIFAWLHILSLPRLSEVLLTLAHQLLNVGFLGNLLLTALHLMLGLVVALLVAVPLGIIAGSNDKIDVMTTSTGAMITAISVTLMLPLFLNWFGPTLLLFIVIVLVDSFFPAYIITREGVKHIPKEYYQLALAFNVGTISLLSKIVLPSIYIGIINSLRTSFALLWEIVIAAEIITRSAGIGSFVYGSNCSPELILAGVLIVTMITFVIDRMVFQLIEMKLRKRYT